MNRQTSYSEDTAKNFVKQDKKNQLKQILKERFSQQDVYKNYNKAPLEQISQTKQKQYTSQATQINEDLINNDINFEDKLKGFEDEEQNKQDKSLYQSIILKSIYDPQQSIKSDCSESSYNIRTKYYQRQFNGENNNIRKSSINPLNFQGMPATYNTQIHRYSSNALLLRNQVELSKDKHKNEIISSYFLKSNIGMPLINPLENQTVKQLKKKNIQINHKEVFKAFCSKQKEENDGILNYVQYYQERNPYYFSRINPYSSRRNSLILSLSNSNKINNNNNSNNEYSYSINKNQGITKISSREQSHDKDQFISHNTSIYEHKNLKKWNLADFSQQIGDVQGNQGYKNNGLNSSQIYKQYQHKLKEKILQSTNSKSYIQQFQIHDKNTNQSTLLANKKKALLSQKEIDTPFLDNIVSQQELLPKLLLKNSFSVKQLIHSSPKKQIESSAQKEYFQKHIQIKQMEIPNQSQQNSCKSKLNQSYSFQLTQNYQDSQKKRNNTTHQQQIKDTKKIEIGNDPNHINNIQQIARHSLDSLVKPLSFYSQNVDKKYHKQI